MGKSRIDSIEEIKKIGGRATKEEWAKRLSVSVIHINKITKHVKEHIVGFWETRITHKNILLQAMQRHSGVRTAREWSRLSGLTKKQVSHTKDKYPELHKFFAIGKREWTKEMTQFHRTIVQAGGRRSHTEWEIITGVNLHKYRNWGPWKELENDYYSGLVIKMTTAKEMCLTKGFLLESGPITEEDMWLYLYTKKYATYHFPRKTTGKLLHENSHHTKSCLTILNHGKIETKLTWMKILSLDEKEFIALKYWLRRNNREDVLALMYLKNDYRSKHNLLHLTDEEVLECKRLKNLETATKYRNTPERLAIVKMSQNTDYAREYRRLHYHKNKEKYKANTMIRGKVNKESIRKRRKANGC